MGGYAGAGATIGGEALNAYGQHEGAQAMSDAWSRQAQDQAGFDAQERAQRENLLAGLGQGGVAFDPRVAEKLTGNMKTAASNAAAAVNAVDSRKHGGARGTTVAKARAGDNTGGIIGRANKDSTLAALLQALAQNGQRVDMLGRTFGTNVGGIRSDARISANGMPQQLDAAGMQGGDFRNAGLDLNALGQIGMMWAMAQPKTPGYPTPQFGSNAVNQHTGDLLTNDLHDRAWLGLN